MDGDELGARLQLLKPYHRATALGDQAMPKLGIFKETHTVTFATQVRRLILHSFANGGMLLCRHSPGSFVDSFACGRDG